MLTRREWLLVVIVATGSKRFCQHGCLLIQPCGLATCWLSCRYHRLQAAALDRQLPPELRAAAQPGFTGYPPPAQLYWQPSANLLHPLQLLSRELTGCAAACRPTQPMKCLLAHLEQVPFGERASSCATSCADSCTGRDVRCDGSVRSAAGCACARARVPCIF